MIGRLLIQTGRRLDTLIDNDFDDLLHETHWFRWRLGLLDFDQGLVGPFCSVEDGFELCGR